MAKENDNIADALHAMTNKPVGQSSIHSANPSQSTPMPVPNPEPKPSARKRSSAPGQVSEEIAITQPVGSIPPPPRKSSPVQYGKAGSITFRQTLIPSCLVAGVILLGFCVYYYIQPESAPIRYLDKLWPILIGIAGAISLGLGIMNIVIVKSQLATQKPRS